MTENNSHTFQLKQTVFVEDTDMTGVVYHANYLKYFERCRSAWLAAQHISQRELQQAGFCFVISHAAIDYLKPLQLNDQIIISTHIQLIKKIKIRFHQAIHIDQNSDKVIATGVIDVVIVEKNSLKPVRIPKTLLEILTHEP